MQLFRIDFRKPDLGEEDRKREGRKRHLKQSLNAIHSRLESVEILNKNHKNDDALLLLRHLLVDMANLALYFCDLPPVKDASDVGQAVRDLPEDGLSDIFEKHAPYLNIARSEPRDPEELFDHARRLANELDKWTHRALKHSLKTPLDEYRRRLTLQAAVWGTVLCAFLVFLFASVRYYQWKYFELQSDRVELFFMKPGAKTVSAENSVKQPLKLDRKWNLYRYTLEPARDMEAVRIDPTTQERVRFSIRYVRFLDRDGRTLFESHFRLNENLIPENADRIFTIHHARPGRMLPGGFSEMISTGNDPLFHLKTGTLRGVASVELLMRTTEVHRPYADE